jgi:hypothetical protein
MIFIKIGFTIVFVFLVVEIFFNNHVPKMHGNLKGRVPYKLPLRPIPRETVSTESIKEVTSSDVSSDPGMPPGVAARLPGSPMLVTHTLQLDVGDEDPPPSLIVANGESHDSIIAFDPASKEWRSHSLLKYAQLSVTASGEGTSGPVHLFHEVELSVSDPLPLASDDTGTRSDCNIYVSLSNHFPNSYENVELDSHSVETLWDWKSNGAGPDELTLHTFRPEFISSLRRPDGKGNLESAPLANELYIAVEKRFSSHKHLLKAAAVGAEALSCLLSVHTAPVEKAELSKQLAAREDGRIVMPQDIAET